MKRQCDECNFFNGHSERCSHSTIDSLRERVEFYKMKYEREVVWRREALGWREMWHGKWAIVKAENNALRRRVSKQFRKDKENNQ